MTLNTTDPEKTILRKEELNSPPLCLVNYLDVREGKCLPHKIHKPPGLLRQARVIERRDNLIILAFPPAVQTAKLRSRYRNRIDRFFDAAMILLLLTSALACIASFRF